MITALIVDDEPVARDVLRMRLEREDDFEVVGEAGNGPAAVEAIRLLKPVVVFLDVKMPGLNGFQVVEQIGPELLPHIVFVTAFDEFAVKAFEVHAVEYLLKPYDQKRLDRALQRVRQMVAGNTPQDHLATAAVIESPHAAVEFKELVPQAFRLNQRLIIKNREQYMLFRIEDIDFIESAGNYVRIYFGEREVLVRGTMTELEKGLDNEVFVRIHRSTIVNVNRVKLINVEGWGDYEVVLSDGRKLRMSRNYRNRLIP